MKVSFILTTVLFLSLNLFSATICEVTWSKKDGLFLLLKDGTRVKGLIDYEEIVNEMNSRIEKGECEKNLNIEQCYLKGSEIFIGKSKWMTALNRVKAQFYVNRLIADSFCKESNSAKLIAMDCNLFKSSESTSGLCNGDARYNAPLIYIDDTKAQMLLEKYKQTGVCK